MEKKITTLGDGWGYKTATFLREDPKSNNDKSDSCSDCLYDNSLFIFR